MEQFELIKDKESFEDATLLALYIDIDSPPNNLVILPKDIKIKKTTYLNITYEEVEIVGFEGQPRSFYRLGHHLPVGGLSQMICRKGDEKAGADFLLKEYVQQCKEVVEMSSRPCLVSPHSDQHYVDEYEITLED